MLKPSLRHLVCLAVLSLGLTSSINGQPDATDEVGLALAAIGNGSVDEMKGRLITNRITVLGIEYRAQAVTALPATILSHRITHGKLFRRVETILNRVLQLHDRGGKVELILFQDDVPSAILWRGCVLALSDGLAEPLYDGELAGIFAHELGHSYFEDEMAAAGRAKDARAMRVVELKCDAVAILSLKLLAYDPTLHLKGLQQIQIITRRKSLSSSTFQSHPEPVKRALFSQRFIKSLALSTSAADQPEVVETTFSLRLELIEKPLAPRRQLLAGYF
ncbi:MAG: M48 family metalloprotease [Pyrinomonadaceae bacterium]